jgi:hypothetical protein
VSEELALQIVREDPNLVYARMSLAPAAIPAAHAIKVRFVGPTDTKGARVVLTSLRFGDRVTIPFRHELGSSLDTAKAWLIGHAWTVQWHAETPKGWLVGVSEFAPLRGE